MTTTLDLIIRTAAEKHLPYLDWRIFRALIQQESRFDPKAKSPVGAMGLAQVMPGTWKDWATRADVSPADPYNPEANVNVGACYLAYLHSQWHSPRPAMDRVCLALASYNAGLGNLLNAQKRVRGALLYREIIRGLPLVTGNASQETIQYVRKILEHYAKDITG